jgi:hypothetical protein
MSAAGKTDLARDWRLALRIREEEADRLAQMSDEDFAKAMATMPEPSRVPSVEELLARGGREGHEVHAVEVPVERAPASPWVWALAAAFALVVAAGIAERDAVVALLRGEHPSQHDGKLTPSQRAEMARAEARKACDRTDWATCGGKLDEAEKLDPAGETSPGVQEMRKAIEAQGWKRVDPTHEKPPLK